jgi:ABC-type Fe3+-hydroxamate transport system substrate-binding protein
MRPRNGLASGLIILALTATLTACSGLGDLTIRNESSTDVTVSTGDERITVSAWGAASILGSGCTPGDIIVEFASEQKVVVNGPVCPDEQLVALDSKVEVRPSQ